MPLKEKRYVGIDFKESVLKIANFPNLFGSFLKSIRNVSDSS